jgi:hypothetical protein
VALASPPAVPTRAEFRDDGAGWKEIEMLRRLGFVAVAAVALVVAAGVPAQAITHGQPDSGGHPYVGELLFFVPDETDSRFDDPGAWFTCTGTCSGRRRQRIRR